jgi:hypothetical protein
MTNKHRGLSRPPRQPTRGANDFIEGAATAETNSHQQKQRKEPVHTFNLRVPVSEFEHLQAWAEKVSPRDSVHALVLKAVREKLARLDDGTETE